MGATGSGPFENDDALDFLDTLEDLVPRERAGRVLEALDVSGYAARRNEVWPVERRGATLVFTTDVGDEVAADLDHPIMVETNAVTGEPQPAVRVRGDLWARIARPVFYELVEMAEVSPEGLIVRSAGTTFRLGEA